MKNLHLLLHRLNPRWFGLIGSTLFSITALYAEPRLILLGVIAGPALVGLLFPPNGRRVYRELGIAGLIASAVISTMLLMAVSASPSLG